VNNNFCDVVETNAPPNGRSVLNFMAKENVPYGNLLVVTASYPEMIECVAYLQSFGVNANALTDANGEIDDPVLGGIIFNRGPQVLVSAAYTLNSLPSFLWINSIHFFCKPQEDTGIRLIGGLITPWPGKNETTRVFVYGAKRGTAVEWFHAEEPGDGE